MATGYKIPKSKIPEKCSVYNLFSDSYVDLDNICTYRVSSNRGTVDFSSNYFKFSSGSNLSEFKFSSKKDKFFDSWNVFLSNPYFKNGTEGSELLIKGSVPTFKLDPLVKVETPGSYTITRTSSNLEISGDTSIKLDKTKFLDGVIPTAIIIVLQAGGGGGAYGESKQKKSKSGGGGGGGGSSKPTIIYDKNSGGGGASGALAAYIIDFNNIESSSVSVIVGSGGSGGTSVSKDGDDGGNTSLKFGTKYIRVYGGGGGYHGAGSYGGSASSSAPTHDSGSGLSKLTYLYGVDGGSKTNWGSNTDARLMRCSRVEDATGDYATYNLPGYYGGTTSQDIDCGGGGGASHFADGGDGGDQTSGKDGYLGSGGGGGGCRSADDWNNGGDGGDGFFWIFY